MKTASVVITTKNRREELLRAVESAIAQRGLLEVVVIDDGSTDGTAEELQKKFSVFSFQSPGKQPATTDLRLAIAPEAPLPATNYSPPVTTGLPVLRLIRHGESRGLIVRRNEGAREAKGDVIFSLDDDAVFSSLFVVEQTLRDFSHPRIGAVAIPYIEPHKANREMQRAPTREDVWITASYIGTAHAVRRDVFLALGGYREHLVHQGEEGDFCLRMLAADAAQLMTDSGGLRTDKKDQKLKAKSGNAEKLKTDLTTIERLGGREKEQPKVGPKGEGVGTTESNDSDKHGLQKNQQGDAQGTCACASESESLASGLADSPVSESRTGAASGPALARIAPGGVGNGGGNQLADSGGGLEGQSQAGLHMDSQKHPTHRVATGSDTSVENSSSVPIREIRGKKNSDAPEALSPATSHSPLATPLEAAVPGFFVRLGNSVVIIHNESPKRDYSRMDFYGRRNDVLFHWQNTPMPDLLWQLPMTIAGGLFCAAKVGRWRKMLEGIGAGFLASLRGVKREPVSGEVGETFKSLKQRSQIFKREVPNSF